MSTALLSHHDVRLTGDGTRPIVFAHGFGGDQRSWRRVAPAFERDWRVVTFDHAGNGRADPAAYDAGRHATLQGYADDLVAIVEALDLRDVVLVGHSVSATLGMLAAVRAPERFACLVMLGPTPCYLEDPPHYHGGFAREDLERLLDLLARDQAAWADAIAPMAIGAADAFPEAAALTQELRDGICAMAPDVALRFARAVFLEDHRALVPRVPVPSVVLPCTADAIVPDGVGEWLRDHLPCAALHRLAATGHCPHMTHPAETIAAIREHLAVRPGYRPAPRARATA